MSVVVLRAGACERFEFPLCHNTNDDVSNVPMVTPSSTGSIKLLLRTYAILCYYEYYTITGALVSVSLPVFVTLRYNILSSTLVSVYPRRYSPSSMPLPSILYKEKVSLHTLQVLLYLSSTGTSYVEQS